MITLKKEIKVLKYQAELSCLTKSDSSPFISILMLALEKELLNAQILRDNLLPALPLIACENLLERLTEQGYLERTTKKRVAAFQLTQLGIQSAEDRSFWNGERGIYNLYFTEPNEINLIAAKLLIRANDDRDGALKETPPFILNISRHQHNFDGKQFRFQDIANNIIELKSMECELTHSVLKDNHEIIIFEEKDKIYAGTDKSTEENIRKEILLNHFKDEYDVQLEAVRLPFDHNNLSLTRNINIPNPKMGDAVFKATEIKNVPIAPLNKSEAQKWYNELLYRNLKSYFFNEAEFNDYAQKQADNILKYEAVKIPSRSEFKKFLVTRKDSFYQTAKLDAINHLNY